MNLGTVILWLRVVTFLLKICLYFVSSGLLEHWLLNFGLISSSLLNEQFNIIYFLLGENWLNLFLFSLNFWFDSQMRIILIALLLIVRFLWTVIVIIWNLVLLLLFSFLFPL